MTRRLILLRFIFIAAIFASVAPIFWPVFLFFFHPQAVCDGKTLSELRSPDGGWLGVIRQEMCADGVFTTAVTRVVQIVRPGDQPTQASVVLSIDDEGNDELGPRLKWVSSNTLEITVPNRSFTGVRKNTYEDISILVTYYPDDPADRALFLKQSGSMPK